MAGQPTILPFLLFPLATSHNITTMLANRKTITVLADNNDAISSASGQPTDELKKILSLHVVLDYYDGDKLPNRSAILTTLFQSSGVASGSSGFLNATDMDNGQVSLGSAVPGSSLDANFVKVLATQPYNISVLQISSVIVPPGLGDGAAAPKASPATSKSAAPSLAPSEAAASPASNTTSPSVDSPTSGAPATSPAEAMAADSSPAGAPSDVADGPAGESSAADGLAVGGGAAAAMGFANPDQLAFVPSADLEDP
ncbi:fasciclin-like arabinogalactan protein [Musa troglodytarum]|uniref:Fasciclin-like arabinogalactan protein n=1 Tax=Musa troglodytarum TaxID=320322 RepID=A0A9E7EB00_9LILI|nr:fasciclin-like arabinogalactan protein [Musa troglodytarum]